MYSWCLIFFVWVICIIQILTLIRCLDGQDFSYFAGCFFTQMEISFAVNKCFIPRGCQPWLLCSLGSYSESVFLYQWGPVYSFILSSVRLRVRGLNIDVLVPSGVEFGVVWVKLHFSTCSYPIWTAPFVEGAVICLLCVVSFKK